MLVRYELRRDLCRMVVSTLTSRLQHTPVTEWPSDCLDAIGEIVARLEGERERITELLEYLRSDID